MPRPTPQILPIIRTDNDSAQTRALVAHLSQAFAQPAMIALDHRRCQAEFDGHRVLPLTSDVAFGFGLDTLRADWGWFCGDICYYAARAATKDPDYYLLIEDDVYLSAEGAQLLATHLRDFEGDGVASRLARYDTMRKYSKGLKNIDLDPHLGCVFPVTMANGRMIEHMLTIRRAAQKKSNYVNDEAVFAAAAFSPGFSRAALGDLLPDALLSEPIPTAGPLLYESLRTAPDQLALRHPVVDLDRIVAGIRAGSRKFKAARLKRLLRSVDEPTRQMLLDEMHAAQAAHTEATAA